jgi:hypothetical protein
MFIPFFMLNLFQYLNKFVKNPSVNFQIVYYIIIRFAKQET